jgi:hypothetical protein
MIDMTREITIIQCGGGWPTNIGNAFIDLGSIYTLKKVCEKSRILLLSNLSKSLLSRISLSRGLLSRSFLYIRSRLSSYPMYNMTNVFDVRELIKTDYFVFSGSILTSSWFKRAFPLKLLKRKVKIIINGGGGPSYIRQEVEAVREHLKKIRPYAFISRDEVAFKNYEDLADYSFNGIDCSFFVKDYFRPLPLDTPKYITFTFDKIRPPKIIDKKGRMIIRLHHSSWPHTGFLTRYPRRDFIQKNTLISDLPEDYLNVYANTEETHSDRVHACAVTLAFRKPARLYMDTPRASLLDRVGAGTARYKLTYPRSEEIEKEKRKQIKFLSEILNPE